MRTLSDNFGMIPAIFLVLLALSIILLPSMQSAFDYVSLDGKTYISNNFTTELVGTSGDMSTIYIISLQPVMSYGYNIVSYSAKYITIGSKTIELYQPTRTVTVAKGVFHRQTYTTVEVGSYTFTWSTIPSTITINGVVFTYKDS